MRDLWRISAFLVIGFGFGILLNAVAWGLLASLAIYLGFFHKALIDLRAWLRNKKLNEPPEHPGVFEEITLEIDYLRERHKKRKKRLASYLNQFQQATRSLPDATVVLDSKETVLWTNSVATRSLGIRWPEDAGQRVTNLIRQPVLGKFLQESIKTPNATLEIESPMERGRYLSILAAPYGDSQRILVARDITQLHRANQIRSDFVANVSHELRTPITVFKGYLETLREQKDICPETWKPAIEQMSVHSERMLQLVEELLLLSALESEEIVVEPTFVEVGALIAEIHRKAVELSGARQHFFSLEIDHALNIRGSRKELFSAFSNMVFNAVNYTQDKGVIVVRWFRDASGASFVVEDNGEGISEEHIPRLTERFYRGDPSRARGNLGGGTGLGLAITKHVLSRHNASLSISSSVGIGSEFRASFDESVIVTDGEKFAPMNYINDTA